HRSALVCDGRRTREAHADTPVVAGRNQQKWKQPACERLDLGAEAFVQPAAIRLGQEHTAAVRPMPQRPASREPPFANEPATGIDLGIAGQTQPLDAAFLFIGDDGFERMAAIAAVVAIPILDERQIADRNGHGDLTTGSTGNAGTGRQIRKHHSSTLLCTRLPPWSLCSPWFYLRTWKMHSISTGMPLGNAAMPTALRAPLPFFSPKISTIKSLKPLMTSGCCLKSGALLTIPSVLTSRSTLSRLP